MDAVRERLLVGDAEADVDGVGLSVGESDGGFGIIERLILGIICPLTAGAIR